MRFKSCSKCMPCHIYVTQIMVGSLVDTVYHTTVPTTSNRTRLSRGPNLTGILRSTLGVCTCILFLTSLCLSHLPNKIKNRNVHRVVETIIILFYYRVSHNLFLHLNHQINKMEWQRIIGGLSGAMSVGMGAYGAHGFRGRDETYKNVFETGYET